MAADPDVLAAAAQLDARDVDPQMAFMTFDQQDSACVSFGIEAVGRRWFVKTATTPEADASLDNALRVHAVVRHAKIVHPVRSFRRPGLTLVYPWCDGTVLNHATTAGSDRSALQRFRRLPLDEVMSAVEVVLDAHCEIARHGLVAVDFYDGCLLYDFDERQMHLIDLDLYRPGPFTLDQDRLPGSTSYMAPEEFERGAVIDERTTVFGLGRMIHHLLDGSSQWRGTTEQLAVVDVATDPDPRRRHQTVDALVDAWRMAAGDERSVR